MPQFKSTMLSAAVHVDRTCKDFVLFRLPAFRHWEGILNRNIFMKLGVLRKEQTTEYQQWVLKPLAKFCLLAHTINIYRGFFEFMYLKPIFFHSWVSILCNYLLVWCDILCNSLVVFNLIEKILFWFICIVAFWTHRVKPKHLNSFAHFIKTTDFLP